MSTTRDPWFVTERSEALAGLLLTSRKDVRIRSKQTHDDVVTFLVEIETGDSLSTQMFLVQVKGTQSPDRREWQEDVRRLFRTPDSSVSLPVSVFVVNVRENRAFSAWMAEPCVEANAPSLRFHETGEFQPLDAAAVDGIINRVKAWYQAMPRQLQPA